jgi:hypothetical protein
MKSLNSKLALSIVALTALVATPALAAHKHTSRTVVPDQLYNSTANPAGTGNTVYGNDGRVIGADPDPQIRCEMSRDAGSSEGAY